MLPQKPFRRQVAVLTHGANGAKQRTKHRRNQASQSRSIYPVARTNGLDGSEDSSEEESRTLMPSNDMVSQRKYSLVQIESLVISALDVEYCEEDR